MGSFSRACQDREGTSSDRMWSKHGQDAWEEDTVGGKEKISRGLHTLRVVEREGRGKRLAVNGGGVHSERGARLYSRRGAPSTAAPTPS